MPPKRPPASTKNHAMASPASAAPTDLLRSTIGQTARASRNVVRRLLTDREFAVRAIRYALRLPTPQRTEDRRVLEQLIFPFYTSRTDFHSVLFVGCDWYTRHYEKVFFKGRNFWTIEPCERARKFGSRRRHVVAPWERLDEYFREGYFDLIISNGVYGFGLDTAAQCQAAFEHSYSRLRDGGHLVFGWNDVPERTPVPLQEIASLKRFTPWIFPAFSSWRYVTDTPHRHVYDFYVK